MIIGIDFGTTNTVTAYMDTTGKIKIITDHDGHELMPSIIGRNVDKLLIGHEIKENINAFIDGEGIKEIKRQIGKNKKRYFDGRYVEASDIASIIIGKAKANAEEYLNKEVKEAVITVPAEFSDAQRKEIIEAATKAGLKVSKIINEPTAALLTYSRQKVVDKKVLCYDFGGGTFDVSIANINSRGIEVIAVGGDRELGGKDIDELIVNYLKKDILATRGKTLNRYGEYRLLLAVEKLKIKLSNSTSAAISIPALETTSGKFSYYKTFSRVEFNNLIKDIVKRTMTIVEDTLDSKNLSYSSIDEVVMVGGSSKIPLVIESIKSKFGNKISLSEDCDKFVALGAAIEAGNLMGVNSLQRTKIKQDVCPFNLGLKVFRDGSDNVFDPIVYKNSPYGVEYSEKYNTAFSRQNSMVLEIYQGESHIATNNEHITDFEITGIPEAAAGEEWVKITFKYDENGIINIKARVLSTGFEKTYSYKYGYDLMKKVDNKIAEDLLIDTDLRLTANQAIKDLDKEGLSSISGKIKEAIKYECQDDLEDLLDDVLR